METAAALASSRESHFWYWVKGQIMKMAIALPVVLLLSLPVGAQEHIFSDDFEWGSICAWSNLWYVDGDGDSWGDPTLPPVSVSCPPPSNFAPRGGDCNDGDENVNPEAGEACNGVDDDCNDLTDEGCCEDLILNGSETDLDCGGLHCSEQGFTCGAGLMCALPRDCTDVNCVEGFCAAGTCSDGIPNQDETDVDCGGICGATCNLDQTCLIDGDCASWRCYLGSCVPTPYPRLLVAGSGGVRVWDNSDQLAGDPVTSIELGGFVGDGLGLAAAGDRLIAVSADPNDCLHLYDGLASISASSTPAAVVPSSVLSGATSEVWDMTVDEGLNLWITTTSAAEVGSVWLFTDVPSMNSSSVWQAQFTHPWTQIFSAVYDSSSPNEKLLAGQVSGAGVVAYDNPLLDTGSGNTPDWTLTTTAVIDLLLVDDSLYLADTATPRIAIWRNVSGISAAQAPDAVMGAVDGLSEPFHLMMRPDDTLVVTNNDAPTDYRILLYEAASDISGDTTPDVEVSHASLILPIKAYLARDDRLYVLTSGSVLIFENAMTTPTLVANIETGVSSAKDFLILE